MASHDHRRLRTAIISAQLAVGCALSACSSSATGTSASAGLWADRTIDAVSRPVSGVGVTAVTDLRKDGTLETSVVELATGKRLWSRPSTMAGRVAGMGVQPPAIAGSGTPGQTVVADVEAEGATPFLVARDVRTGEERWTRQVGTTFGPARCGRYLCLSENTARKDAHFAAVDPATGKTVWQMPGIGEVEWSDGLHTVVFRMAAHPVLESHELATGKIVWSYPVEKAVGNGVNLSGGWSFGALGDDTLVGYVAPYQARQGKELSAYGFFALRISDGTQVWARPKMLRLYPSAAPAVALITREVDDKGRYGGFAQLDPRTGETISRISADKAPRTGWWLAFPADLSTIGFLSRDHKGTAYDLRKTTPVPPAGLHAWSFCTITPSALPIKGQPGFFPVAALCAYDLSTGKQVANPGPPPGWYTGATDGWRVWRDQSGTLHGIHDAEGTVPGMYS